MPVIIKHDHYGLGYKLDDKTKKKRIASLVGVLVEREHMVFPHIRETFYSARVQNNDIKPSGVASLKEFENLSINAIEGIDVKEEDVRAVVSPISSRALKNWAATNIPTVFHLS